MVIRFLAAATTLALGVGLAQAREATTSKQPDAAASTTDPLEVPRAMHDWFAKSVDDILTDEGATANEKPADTKPRKRH